MPTVTYQPDKSSSHQSRGVPQKKLCCKNFAFFTGIFFDEVSFGMRSKWRDSNRCFPVNIAEFLITHLFWITSLHTTASENNKKSFTITFPTLILNVKLLTSIFGRFSILTFLGYSLYYRRLGGGWHLQIVWYLEVWDWLLRVTIFTWQFHEQ